MAPGPRTWRPPHWAIAVLSVVNGLVLLGAAALGGHVLSGVVMLIVSSGLGLSIMTSEREPAAAGEYSDRRASAVAGVVLMLAIMAGFIWEVAQGHDGWTYAWLASVGVAAYTAALLWIDKRR